MTTDDTKHPEINKTKMRKRLKTITKPPQDDKLR